ncbi:MAG: hypothetical protein M3O70_11470 [Actinomycetota bacterium]|nr:hypothetical protein [Actinomycetota bacterium]
MPEPLQCFRAERDDVCLRIGGEEEQTHVEVVDVSAESAVGEVFTGVEMELLSAPVTRPSGALCINLDNGPTH